MNEQLSIQECYEDALIQAAKDVQTGVRSHAAPAGRSILITTPGREDRRRVPAPGEWDTGWQVAYEMERLSLIAMVSP